MFQIGLCIIRSGKYHYKMICVLLLSFIVWTDALATQPPPPNIVLVYVDDQGWTGTSVQMDNAVSDSKSDFYETPNLMHFVSQSMRFSNAYAPSPLCSPSRISVQTGKSPARTGMTDIIREPNFIKKIHADPKKLETFRRERMERKLIEPASISEISKEDITIAEMVKSSNPDYVTGFLGKWHLGSDGPGSHGYDVHDGETWNSDGHMYPPNPKDTFGITNRALSFLADRVEDGRPFFLQVSYYAVHRKVIALEETIKKYEAARPGDRHSHAVHAAMTENLDDGFGRLMDAIRKHPGGEQTYVFYMSDNGAYLHGITNNAPLARGKASLREGGIRVPFFVGGPGITPGAISDVPVIGWDLFPTIADIIESHLPLPEGLEGGSLKDLLLGNVNDSVARPRGSQLVWYMPHYSNSHGVTPHSAIRIGRYKLIEEYETGDVFLYDLSSDIAEANNLANNEPSITEEMVGILHEYLREIGVPAIEKNPDWCWWCFWH